MAPRAAPRAAQRSDHPDALADRLHSAAIHLLRRLRRVDDRTGLTAPRLSALSVLVFGGPMTIGQLATAEQVRAPTMTRLVAGLEADGLVRRRADPGDRRQVWLEPTAAGRSVLARGRARRVAALAARVRALPAADRAALAAAIGIVERVARAGDAPDS